MEQGALEQLVGSQVERIIVNLYKSQLSLLQELNQEHLENLAKFQNQLDADARAGFGYFDAGKMGRLRKRTLDSGNEAVREVQNLIGSLDIKLKAKSE